MNKRLVSFAGGLALAVSMTGAALAQTTQTTTTTTQTTAIQNADGTWTVVEYPVGREVRVNLTPGTTISGATGYATVLRRPNGTLVKVNLTGLPSDMSAVNLYAVDPSGAVSLLGPVTVSNGTGTFSTTTPLNQFMIVASPEGSLTTINDTTPLVFRSAVPQGLAVVPLARSGEGPGSPVGEKASATAVGTATSSPAGASYAVPMLNIPSLPAKKETEMHLSFSEPVNLVRGTVFITPNFNNQGATRIKLKLHELSRVPKGTFLTLWAVGPNGEFTHLGATSNRGKPNVATIDTDKLNTNVRLQDFGLFMTTEKTSDIVSPAGPVVVRIQR